MVDPAQGDPTARALHEAAQRGDWGTVRDLLGSVTDPDDHAFHVSVLAGVTGVQDWIGEWVDAEPRSSLPLLVRGAHAVFWAWEARGGARAAQTGQDQFREFWRRLKFAENCLDEVVEREPDDTTARTFLVVSARGREVDPAEAQRRFDEVVTRHPGHRLAHEHMLQYLCRKWSGSHEQMFGFAREALAKAPAGSPLGQLVPAAHLEMWLDLPPGEDADYIGADEVIDEMNAAADQSVRHPSYVRRPGWATVHNLFAMGFAFSGDLISAAGQFDVIGDQVTAWPWQYFDGADPAGAFSRSRDKAYAARA
ncbi:hypothetical protein [Verrucosispora sioxanthis]|uniref:DUF4034 domain-containing protein n=1 Tax=Verrucosispora sioxanthis TaxID=2499994 RepID=A0A6M1L551_9ACTN|nr:hypothetical protein [Verrucosispora sioxanthis]NEE64740.1 hypothetical protein [Verrucosispora sioxanthis]NGM13850.1 hypothetical protein [Verrucosispora sioxanthis]